MLGYPSHDCTSFLRGNVILFYYWSVVHSKKGFVTLANTLVIWDAVHKGDVVLTTKHIGFIPHAVILLSYSAKEVATVPRTCSAVSCMWSPLWFSEFEVCSAAPYIVPLSHWGILPSYRCRVAHHFITSIFMTTLTYMMVYIAGHKGVAKHIKY